jgi:hypothetical protein
VVKLPSTTKKAVDTKTAFMSSTSQPNHTVKITSHKKAAVLATLGQPYSEQQSTAAMSSSTKRAKTPSQNNTRLNNQKRHSSTEMNCYIPHNNVVKK